MENLESYATVQKWLAANRGGPLLPRPESPEHRLAVLGAYLDHVGVDPDKLISVSTDLVEGGTATRNGYLKQLKVWLAGQNLPEGERTRRENLIRGFFIANAIKVMTKPYSDVYKRNPAR
jgi:hypothetical protein